MERKIVNSLKTRKSVWGGSTIQRHRNAAFEGEEERMPSAGKKEDRDYAKLRECPTYPPKYRTGKKNITGTLNYFSFFLEPALPSYWKGNKH